MSGNTSQVEKMWEEIRLAEVAPLATAAGNSVTMRGISPVPFGDRILLFTEATSTKYKQLEQNPSCCLMVGGCYLECKAELCGPTTDDKNEAMRAAYEVKYPDAFDPSVPFGGVGSDFVVLTPVRLSGWVMESEESGQPFEHVF